MDTGHVVVFLGHHETDRPHVATAGSQVMVHPQLHRIRRTAVIGDHQRRTIAGKRAGTIRSPSPHQTHKHPLDAVQHPRQTVHVVTTYSPNDQPHGHHRVDGQQQDRCGLGHRQDRLEGTTSRSITRQRGTFLVSKGLEQRQRLPCRTKNSNRDDENPKQLSRFRLAIHTHSFPGKLVADSNELLDCEIDIGE